MSLEHSDISRMLEVTVVAARLAGQRAMEEIKYITPHIKNGSEIVTNADPVCQKIIVDRIKETYPDHGFIAEEGPEGRQLCQPPRGADNIWWVIDPIDGTNNYANGILDFTVSIAAFHEGSPIAAAVFEPATDSMFSTAKDTDALLNSSRINVSTDEITPYTSFGIDSHFTIDMEPAIREVIRKTRFRNLGSTALHLAYVAKGAMIGAITPQNKLWDIAAGVLLIQNAGGIVTCTDGNPVFPVENVEEAGHKQYSLLAANRTIHAEVLKLLHSK